MKNPNTGTKPLKSNWCIRRAKDRKRIKRLRNRKIRRWRRENDEWRPTESTDLNLSEAPSSLKLQKPTEE